MSLNPTPLPQKLEIPLRDLTPRTLVALGANRYRALAYCEETRLVTFVQSGELDLEPFPEVGYQRSAPPPVEQAAPPPPEHIEVDVPDEPPDADLGPDVNVEDPPYGRRRDHRRG